MANQNRAIREAFTRLGLHISTKQVVEALAELGVETNEALVLSVKGQMAREQAKVVREQAKRPPKSKSHNRPQQRKIPPRRG